MSLRYLTQNISLDYQAEKCIGCRRCTQVCPHGVFAMRDKRASLDCRDRCMECGACARNCPSGAIAVSSGVGCAAAMINGLLTTGDPDKGTCDCSGSTDCC